MKSRLLAKKKKKKLFLLFHEILYKATTMTVLRHSRRRPHLNLILAKKLTILFEIYFLLKKCLQRINS